MSLESVKQYLVEHAPDLSIIEVDADGATVPMAAVAFGVSPGQIAKTLSLSVGEDVIVVVTRGDSRLDNRKYKDRFGVKARFLAATEVEKVTGHPIGGVCPFALPSHLPVYCDVSLKDFSEVIPAAGVSTAGVRITPERLAHIVNAHWIDVMQLATESASV